MPARDWTSGSQPGSSREGPLPPQALMEQVTRRGRPCGASARARRVERAGPQVLEQDVGLVEEGVQPLPALGGSQVELDGLLAPIPGGEACGVGPLGVTPRTLDLDHLGAQVGEDRGGQRCGHVLAHLDDADAVEDAGQ